MASVSSQVLFHPVVSKSLKVGATSLGRDKCYRAIQYFARFYAWYLTSRGGDKLTVARCNALKSHLATARKLLRLGKPIEHLRNALTVDLSLPLPESLTAISRQLAYFAYLSLDAVVWANSIKILTLQPEKARKIGTLSNKFWAAAIASSLVNSSFKIVRVTKEMSRLRPLSEKGLGAEVDRELKLRNLNIARSSAITQLAVDFLDFWIPATNVGYTSLNDGWLGIFGLITSVMALQGQWKNAK